MSNFKVVMKLPQFGMSFVSGSTLPRDIRREFLRTLKADLSDINNYLDDETVEIEFTEIEKDKVDSHVDPLDETLNLALSQIEDRLNNKDYLPSYKSDLEQLKNRIKVVIDYAK